MYRVVLLVAGIVFLLVGAVLLVAVQTGNVDVSERWSTHTGWRVIVGTFAGLFVGGSFFVWIAVKETLFPNRRNEAIRRRREKERARGVIRR